MAEIEYAFLADAAEALPGQKFHVLGGGVSRLSGPSFPFQHPHLALVVALRIGAAERSHEHDLSFEITSPAGEQLATAGGKVVAHGPPDPSDVVLTLAIDLWNLALPVPGEYAVRILLGGAERKRLPLYVTQAQQEPAPRYVQ